MRLLLLVAALLLAGCASAGPSSPPTGVTPGGGTTPLHVEFQNGTVEGANPEVGGGCVESPTEEVTPLTTKVVPGTKGVVIEVKRGDAVQDPTTASLHVVLFDADDTTRMSDQLARENGARYVRLNLTEARLGSVKTIHVDVFVCGPAVQVPVEVAASYFGGPPLSNYAVLAG